MRRRSIFSAALALLAGRELWKPAHAAPMRVFSRPDTFSLPPGTEVFGTALSRGGGGASGLLSGWFRASNGKPVFCTWAPGWLPDADLLPLHTKRGFGRQPEASPVLSVSVAGGSHHARQNGETPAP